MHAFRPAAFAVSNGSAATRLNVGRPAECDAWARIFDVSYRELIAAVKAVGEDVERVHVYLQACAAQALDSRRAASPDAC